MKTTERSLWMGETLVEKEWIGEKNPKEANLTVNLLKKAPE